MKDLVVVGLFLFECLVCLGMIDVFDFFLCFKFMEMFIKIFDLCLLLGWKCVIIGSEILCWFGIVIIMYLICDKVSLDVDIDLCLCVLIRVDDFKGVLFILDDVSLYFIDYFIV